MTAAETYSALIDAVISQRARIHGERPQTDPWSGPIARRFRHDPHRELDANLKIIASYVQPEDVLIDCGGGAGRISLPLALRCREVINVDPSSGMRAEFDSSGAGITNARFVQADWLEAEGIEGDVTIAASVTYFVQDIVAFIEKLKTASRRRVMITIWSVPPPNQSAKLFRLVYNEELRPVPGHRELLPVLWELDILPDVHVLPGPTWGVELPQTHEEAVQLALQGRWLKPEDQAHAHSLIEAHFHELFAQSPEGFRPLWHNLDGRELLITWQPGHRH